MGQIIGITGGIGSGKTEVCKLFVEQHGYLHYNADIRVKELYVSNAELFEKVQKLIPEAIEYNQIIFKKLGEIVFADAQKLNALNQIIAPIIIKDFTYWVANVIHDKNQNIVLESAILTKSELIKSCHFVIYVYADEASRRNRVSERDGRTKEQLNQIFKLQNNVEEFVEKSNLIINNSYNKMHLLNEVVKIAKILK